MNTSQSAAVLGLLRPRPDRASRRTRPRPAGSVRRSAGTWRKLGKRQRVVAPTLRGRRAALPATHVPDRPVQANHIATCRTGAVRRSLGEGGLVKPSTFCVISGSSGSAGSSRPARGAPRSARTRRCAERRHAYHSHTSCGSRPNASARGERFGPEVLPQPIGAAKRRHAARGRHARTGEHRDARARGRVDRRGAHVIRSQIAQLHRDRIIASCRCVRLSLRGQELERLRQVRHDDVGVAAAGDFDVGHVRVQLLQRRHHVARARYVDGVVGVAVHDELRDRLHAARRASGAPTPENAHQRRPGLRILRAERPRADRAHRMARSGRCATRPRCRRPSSTAALRARPSRCTRRGGATRRRPRP